MTVHDDTHQKILDAAKRRFMHYGYSKTTMAELAVDCDMSPGNLYRYFAGKLDIAEAICREAASSQRRAGRPRSGFTISFSWICGKPSTSWKKTRKSWKWLRSSRPSGRNSTMRG
jgi:hypothetical protein